MSTTTDHTSPRIAVLYQALPPPLIDGLRKDAKPGGYSDSGADIAFALRQAGNDVLAPVVEPDAARALDWVFPDTAEGIAEALERGATLLWANTVLFAGHPIEAVLHRASVVGQLPQRQQDADDKFATNAMLRAQGLPVAASCLAGREPMGGVPAVDAFDADVLSRLGLAFPLIVKPVRGRGSQGVTLVRDLPELRRAAGELLDGGAFGNALIVEQFLDGEELTLTVMPRQGDLPAHLNSDAASALPPVRRFNHDNGVAPYNGIVAVTQNSAALTSEETDAPAVRALITDCLRAYERVGARAPIRIDCRADASGRYRLFDLNMKPNMTGAGRPGREDQDSLSAIAARALGWSYVDLLARMAAGAWHL